MNRAAAPFRFTTRLTLRQLTGVKAATLEELCLGIETLPGSVIFHHTHHFLQLHQYLVPEPPNDFAYWVRENLGEDRLAEELLSVPTHEFASIRLLREKFVDILRSHLKRHKGEHRVVEGEEFHFVRAVSFILATPHEAWDLRELADGLKKATVESLYFHFFEARLRLERGSNDFSTWLEQELGEKDLARKLARLDPYSHTMEGLRARVLALVQSRVAEIERA